MLFGYLMFFAAGLNKYKIDNKISHDIHVHLANTACRENSAPFYFRILPEGEFKRVLIT